MPPLTLIHPAVIDPTEPAAQPLPPTGYLLRATAPADIEELGALYFHSYDPGQACADVAEAIADIRAAFAGEYGELCPKRRSSPSPPTGRLPQRFRSSTAPRGLTRPTARS